MCQECPGFVSDEPGMVQATRLASCGCHGYQSSMFASNTL